jgi:creatinine amidohydrolase
VFELEALTAPALRGVIDRGMTTVIVPFGSVEHQGGHLPLGADALLADFVGQEVAARVDGVLAPTVRVGVAEQHMHLPGTLTVSAATLADTAVEIGESLARQGFRTIALVSTHGGNAASLRAAVERLNARLDGVRACAPEGDVGPHPGGHSGEWLTSVMLALRPDLVDLQANDVQAQRGANRVEQFVASIVDAV